jgi:hypothetical protein
MNSIIHMLITILPLCLMIALAIYAARRDCNDYVAGASDVRRQCPALILLGGTVGWLIIATLVTIYGILLGAYAVLLIVVRTASPDRIWDWTGRALLFMPWVCTWLSFGLFWSSVRLSRLGQTTTKWTLRAGIVVVLLIPLAYLMTDAPPVENDYTWKDIPTEVKNPEESYKTMMSLHDTKIDWKSVFRNVHYGSLELETDVLAHAAPIEEAWRMLEPGRKVIEDLDEFESIGDLTTEIDVSVRKVFIPLRNLYQQYWVNCHLKVEQGNSEEAARQLVKLQSVSRKALPNARLLVSKMIWIAVSGGNIDEAALIARSPKCTPEALRILRDGFPSLGNRETSLRTALMGDYLFGKNILEEQTNVLDFLPIRRIVNGKEEESSDVLKPIESRITMALGYRKNRTIRDLKAYSDLRIAATDKDPPDFTASRFFIENRVKRPDLRNLAGWSLWIKRPDYSMSKAAGTLTKIRVKSELLTMELNARLGKKVVLPDYYTGGEYLVDEKTGEFYSKGPDGIAGTEDDVRLGKY